MSNHLAIAAATSTLATLMKGAAKVVNGADATIQRPKESADTALINVYLYQISFNPNSSNADLPTRREDGTLLRRPQAALDLYYLLSFYGKDELDALILLGSATSILHAQPILTGEMIRKEIERRIADNPNDPLTGADLAEQIEKIRFTPLSLNLEEMSKLWSVLLQVKYTLSVAYKASVVLIEANVSPQIALPVRTRGIHVIPFNRPEVEKVHAEEGEEAAILYNSKVIVTGRQLKGGTTKVRIGEVEVPIEPTDTQNTVTDTKIGLSLGSTLFSGMPLRAGVQVLQVLHPMMMGIPKVEHYGFESNVKPFVLHPAIIDKPDEVDKIESARPNEIENTLTEISLKLGFAPKVGREQRVTALLSRLDHTPGERPLTYTLEAPPFNGIEDPDAKETEYIKFSLLFDKKKSESVESGDYLLLVQVDGAQSPLETSPDPADPNKYSGPKVTIP